MRKFYIFFSFCIKTLELTKIPGLESQKDSFLLSESFSN